MTYTPALASDGSGTCSGNVATIIAIGDPQRRWMKRSTMLFRAPEVAVGGEDYGVVEMRQSGLPRPLSAKELSDRTLRYLLLAAALLSPRQPEIMILNEPEASLCLAALMRWRALMLHAVARLPVSSLSRAANA